MLRIRQPILTNPSFWRETVAKSLPTCCVTLLYNVNAWTQSSYIMVLVLIVVATIWAIIIIVMVRVVTIIKHRAHNQHRPRHHRSQTSSSSSSSSSPSSLTAFCTTDCMNAAYHIIFRKKAVRAKMLWFACLKDQLCSVLCSYGGEDFCCSNRADQAADVQHRWLNVQHHFFYYHHIH